MNVIEYYMSMAKLAAERSTCLRRKIGSVAVKEDRLQASGRNGQVSGTPHCKVCIREEMKIPSGQDTNTCYSVHAEQNLLVQASLHGINLTNSTIYVTNKPCFTCIKLLASIKPTAIIYADSYPDGMTEQFLLMSNWSAETYTHDDESEYTILRPFESRNLPLNKLFRGIHI